MITYKPIPVSKALKASTVSRNNIEGYKQLSDGDRAIFDSIKGQKFSAPTRQTIQERVDKALAENPSFELVKVIETHFYSQSLRGIAKYYYANLPADKLINLLQNVSNPYKIGVNAEIIGLLSNPEFFDYKNNKLMESFITSSTIPIASKQYIVEQIVSRKMLDMELAGFLFGILLRLSGVYKDGPVEINVRNKLNKKILTYVYKTQPDLKGLPDDWVIEILSNSVIVDS